MISKEYKIDFDTSEISDFEERLEKWCKNRLETGGKPEDDLKIILIEEIEEALQLIELHTNKVSEIPEFTPRDLANVLVKLQSIDKYLIECMGASSKIEV